MDACLTFVVARKPAGKDMKRQTDVYAMETQVKPEDALRQECCMRQKFSLKPKSFASEPYLLEEFGEVKLDHLVHLRTGHHDLFGLRNDGNSSVPPCASGQLFHRDFPARCQSPYFKCTGAEEPVNESIQPRSGLFHGR